MPHQCLNCGHVIERGSDEILKGCSACGGKKFIFTSTPMSREKRESMKMRADKVRDKMIQKADPDLMKILKERGVTDIDGSQIELDDTLGEDWVRYRPGEEEEKIEIDEGGSDVTTEIIKGGKGSKRSARDLIQEYDKKVKKKEVKKEAPKKKKKKPAKKKVRTVTETVRRVPSPEKGEDDVDVINILEQGVYEIDVEKLLDDNPIVIQKDGSYLIHLPTIFKESREKKK